MKAAILIKEIKATKGKLYAWVSSKHDGHYLAIEKADLIRHLSRYEANDETGYRLLQSVTGEHFLDVEI